jgi:hypothetical protein
MTHPPGPILDEGKNERDATADPDWAHAEHELGWELGRASSPSAKSTSIFWNKNNVEFGYSLLLLASVNKCPLPVHQLSMV